MTLEEWPTGLDSQMRWLASLPAEERAELIGILGEGERTAALLWLSDWRNWARESQQTPTGRAWRVWLLMTGRGWGKNATQSGWLHLRVRQQPGSVGFIAGRTLSDVARNVIHHPTSGILATAWPDNACEYRQAKGGGGFEVRWKNGSRAEIHTSEEPDRARGPEYAWGLADEIATWKRVLDFENNTTWDNLYLATRAKGEQTPQIVAGTTPRRGSALLRDLLKRSEDPDDVVVVTRGSTKENLAFLSPEAYADWRKSYAGTPLERQELDGVLLPDVEDALVTSEMIAQSRKLGVDPETLQRIGVGVDPSGGREEQGIVGAAVGPCDEKCLEEIRKDCRGHLYVLADRSCLKKPAGWGKQVTDLYRLLGADRIFGEKNYGGDMVESTIRAADPAAAYENVHASRGKHIRFEPLGALYAQGRVHHVGDFPALEDEIVCFTVDGYDGEGSPNRADALVWVATKLILGEKRLVTWTDLYGTTPAEATQ